MTEFAFLTIVACIRKQSERLLRAGRNTTGGWRDKKAHRALRSVGCFYWVFHRAAHCAEFLCTVPLSFIYLIICRFLHGAGGFHVRRT